MPKGVYKRKKAGRPKGSKNKDKQVIFNWTPAEEASIARLRIKQAWVNADRAEATEPASFLSRLEAATVKYEQAIDYLVTTLKGN